MADKVRLSLEVSVELNETLERLAVDLGGTKSDVLRKAIALLKVATDAQKNGQRTGLADKDQPLAVEIAL